jgi:L-iditol 2-dehydrogenase
MKALVKYERGEGNVAVMDVEEPRCGPGRVRIEVAYCGVCGTDLHVLHDTYRNYPPVILGHEIAGTVVETGAGVARVKTGDRVAILGASTVLCGECVYCRSGYFIFCPKRRGMGHGVNGAFARYLVAREDQAYPLPEGFDLDEGALCEPFAATVQAVAEVTEVRPGDVALVSGPGPIGLMCLKLLVSEGVRTIVAGTAEDGERLAAARRIGADAVVDVSRENLMDVVREKTDGFGVDAAFECAGHPASARNCLEAVRPLGQYTQVGICGREAPLSIDAVFFKQLRVQGSFAYTAKTWRRMMSILATGRIRLADLITERLPLDRWEDAFALCQQKRAVKVVIDPR